MATIVSSVIARADRQIDERFAVTEAHTDDSGNLNYVNYLADSGTDLNVHLAASAQRLEQQLTNDKIEHEISANLGAVISLGSLAHPAFVFSTLQQNAEPLISIYNSSSGTTTIMIGDFLNAQTDDLLVAGSGLTKEAIDALRPAWQQNATTAAQIRSAAPAGA